MSDQRQGLLQVLPAQLRSQVDNYWDDLQEVRLRLGRPIQLRLKDGQAWLKTQVTPEHLRYCVNVATQHSPWAAQTLQQGFVTCPQGHRLGFCGSVATDRGTIRSMPQVHSVCIRVCRQFLGVSAPLEIARGSILVIGRPGCGKTTFLRDVIRRLGNCDCAAVAVVDERRELFPCPEGKFCFDTGKATDVLCGVSKAEGIDMVLRTMGPTVIAVDEITRHDDCEALLRGAWCGVRLLATAHAGSRQELFTRPVYRPLLDSGVFDRLVVMGQDKTWQEEML